MALVFISLGVIILGAGILLYIIGKRYIQEEEKINILRKWI